MQLLILKIQVAGKEVDNKMMITIQHDMLPRMEAETFWFNDEKKVSFAHLFFNFP